MEKILVLESLLNPANCHSLNCICSNDMGNKKKLENMENLSKAETFESNEVFSFNNNSENGDKGNNNHSCCKKNCDDKNHECFCEITKEFNHKHDVNCGHQMIYHNGHIDYIVDDCLHFPHNDHCDNHGKINVINIF